MIFDREIFGFGVEVARRGHLEGAKAGTEGMVLDSLEFGYVGKGKVREPDRRCIGKDRTEDGAVGEKHGLLLCAPGGASQGFEDVKAGGGAGNDVGNMGGKGEMGVKGDP